MNTLVNNVIESKTDEPKAGADLGKIVNLMAGDCMRVIEIPRTFHRAWVLNSISLTIGCNDYDYFVFLIRR